MSLFLILILPVLLLIVPIAIQVGVGKKALNQKKVLKYIVVSGSTLLLEVMMASLGLVISLKGQQMKGVPGLSPGVIGFGVLGIAILVVVIIAQLVSKR
jgi:hypothetical protein